MLKPLYGLDRRGLRRAAAAGVVGASLPKRVSLAGESLAGESLAGESIAARPVGFGKAKSVLIVLLSGGPSQLDSLDPKPDAPAEVRGEFTPIATTIPGVAVCEHLPKLAQQMDHWAHAYSGLFAGAGIMGGQVLGQTDAQAACPVTNSWSPADICSTIFNALGVDSSATLKDRLNRPHHLLNGNVISNLYTGATA